MAQGRPNRCTGSTRPGAGGDGPLRQGRVQVHALLLHVREHRGGAHLADGLGGGEEGEGGGDHLVPGADAQGPEGDDQGVGAGIAADGVAGPQVAGGLLLEGPHLGAEDDASHIR